jgi:hypothetical protein
LLDKGCARSTGSKAKREREREQRGRGAEGDKEGRSQNKRKNRIGFSLFFQSAGQKLEPKRKEQSCKTKVVPEVERERQREKKRKSREKEKQKETKKGRTKNKKALSPVQTPLNTTVKHKSTKTTTNISPIGPVVENLLKCKLCSNAKEPQDFSKKSQVFCFCLLKI